MKAHAGLWVSALTVFLTGCAGIGEIFKEPEVRLERAIVRGISLTGGNLDLVVKVDNPNNFTLHGTRLEVGLDVEGSHLGDITYDDDFSVTESGATTVTLPLQFGWAGVGGAVRTALSSGELPYKMKGQLELETPLGRRKIPFTHEGRVPLIRSPGTLAIPGQTQ